MICYLLQPRKPGVGLQPLRSQVWCQGHCLQGQSSWWIKVEGQICTSPTKVLLAATCPNLWSMDIHVLRTDCRTFRDICPRHICLTLQALAVGFLQCSRVQLGTSVGFRVQLNGQQRSGALYGEGRSCIRRWVSWCRCLSGMHKCMNPETEHFVLAAEGIKLAFGISLCYIQHCILRVDTPHDAYLPTCASSYIGMELKILLATTPLVL